MRQVWTKTLLLVCAVIQFTSGQQLVESSDRYYELFDGPEAQLALVNGYKPELAIDDEPFAIRESKLDEGEEALLESLYRRLLSRQAASQDEGDIEDLALVEPMKRRTNDESYFFYNVNSHLPANNLYGVDGDKFDNDDSQSLSDPVNDPEEFEAKLGQLTNELNHKLQPDSPVRNALLLSLMSGNSSLDLFDLVNSNEDVRKLGAYLELKLRDLETEASQQEDLPSSTLPSESRYGGSEYIDHPLSLAGHQFVQGGAGEGSQLLGPDGTFENVQVIKSDSAVPSYCNPPNPCPIGYTASDGCLENFINSASFSREYQAKQKCSCDNEHSLFNCASPTLSNKSLKSQPSNGMSINKQQPISESEAAAEAEAEQEEEAGTAGQDNSLAALGGRLMANAKLNTLARTIANRFGDLTSVQRLIADHQQAQHREENQQDESSDSNYLVRSARKWSPQSNMRKIQLD